MADFKGLDAVERQIRGLEDLIGNPAQLASFCTQEFEKLAYENLRDSHNERDRKATVEIKKNSPVDFEVIVKRPPPEQKKVRINKKDLTPGRYFEIHGPGGRVKITTNVDVMMKAKKQGVHVQMKYKMPDGKTPTTFGIYGAGKEAERIDGVLDKKDIIDRGSSEYRAVLLKINNWIDRKLELTIGRAS